jgi:hypothetical protein
MQKFETTEVYVGKSLSVRHKELAPRAGFELATLRLIAEAVNNLILHPNF